MTDAVSRPATTRPATHRSAASAAAGDAHTPADLLGDFLWVLDDVARAGRRLTEDDRAACREVGARAADENRPLGGLLDLYLSAAWRVWRELPGVRDETSPARLRFVAEMVLRAVDDAAQSLTEGYQAAQRLAIRREEALRREFIDDLLSGRADVGGLARRAQQFGLALGGDHMVAAVIAVEPFTDGDPRVRRAEAALHARYGEGNVLVATKGGRLVAVLPGASVEATRELGAWLVPMIGPSGPANAAPLVSLGRSHAGATGVVQSYDEARQALDLAHRLALPGPVVHAADFLVYQVLLRDRAAIADLVEAVLSPLERARGGAEPLVTTLQVFFATGCTTAASARALHLSVRAVTYRLERVKTLTGYDPDDSAHRLTLHVAVEGARLLGWPGSGRAHG